MTTQPTDNDQFMLELINRGRANPLAEANRYLKGDLNEGLSPGTISPDPKQPLAFNLNLNSAATAHSQWMLDTNQFSHTGMGGSSSSQRIANAGYNLELGWGTGENIGFSGTTGSVNSTQYTNNNYRALLIDEGYPGRGHRVSLMNAKFKEIGIANLEGIYKQGGTNYNALMTTQNFAYRDGSGPFITGVIYSDAVDNDNFYSPGEGIGNITITATDVDDPTRRFTTTSWDTGGYSLEVSPSSTYSVSFKGDLNGDRRIEEQQIQITVEERNEKLDLVTDSIQFFEQQPDWLTGETIDFSGAQRAKTNEGRSKITGNNKDNILIASQGIQILRGKSGADLFAIEEYRPGQKDKIRDFNSGEGDKVGLASKDLLSGDEINFAIANNRRHLRKLFKKDSNLIYWESKGRLYLDRNGSAQSAGLEGGLIAQFNGAPLVTQTDFLVF